MQLFVFARLAWRHWSYCHFLIDSRFKLKCMFIWLGLTKINCFETIFMRLWGQKGSCLCLVLSMAPRYIVTMTWANLVHTISLYTCCCEWEVQRHKQFQCNYIIGSLWFYYGALRLGVILLKKLKFCYNNITFCFCKFC